MNHGAKLVQSGRFLIKIISIRLLKIKHDDKKKAKALNILAK